MACANTDIAGYNYMTARYEMDGKEHPDRVIVGSETNPPDIADNWEYVKRLSYVIGDFTWTGWDYIGEAGIESGLPTGGRRLQSRISMPAGILRRHRYYRLQTTTFLFP